jgi:hypothetical protein
MSKLGFPEVVVLHAATHDNIYKILDVANLKVPFGMRGFTDTTSQGRHNSHNTPEVLKRAIAGAAYLVVQESLINESFDAQCMILTAGAAQPPTELILFDDNYKPFDYTSLKGMEQ